MGLVILVLRVVPNVGQRDQIWFVMEQFHSGSTSDLENVLLVRFAVMGALWGLTISFSATPFKIREM